MKLVKDTDGKILDANNVSDKEAEEAFKTILTWLGEDPNRDCLLYTSPSPRDRQKSRMPSSA